MQTYYVLCIRICTDEINVDDEMLENVDTHTYGDKKTGHYIRYRVICIFKKYFIKKNVTVQAQMLKGLLSLRKLKEATTLLGIRKSTKE